MIAQIKKLFMGLSSLRSVNGAMLLLACATAFGSLPRFKFLPILPKQIFSHPLFLIVVFYLGVGVCLYVFKKIKNRGSEGSGLLFHLGLLLVLLGGVTTWRFADIRDIEISEGETFALAPDQKLKLEKFIIHFPTGKREPENYASRLRVQEKDEVYLSELKVNSPLRIGPWKLFQMRYRYVVKRLALTVFRSGVSLETLELVPGERKELSGAPFSIEVREVLPDFAIDQNKKVVSRSIYFHNPAASVFLYPGKSGKALLQSWAFKGFRMQHDPGKTAEWAFVLDRIATQYTSGIKISKDPGVPIVYTGFLFLIVAAFMGSFVRSHPKISLGETAHPSTTSEEIPAKNETGEELVGCFDDH